MMLFVMVSEEGLPDYVLFQSVLKLAKPSAFMRIWKNRMDSQ